MIAPMKINIQEYYPLILKITKLFPKKYREELFNECYVQLEALSERFDPSVGTFQTYAFKRLYFACKDFISTNSLSGSSLDEFIQDSDNESIRRGDLLEDESDFESDFMMKDWIQNKNKDLTDVEIFIRNQYYVHNLSVKEIIRIYQPYHHITSADTIYKILNK